MAIITISRGSKSGGQALAECVASALSVPCVGREILVDAAARAGVSEDQLRDKLEHSPGLWDRMTSERQVYVAALQAALADHVAGGSLVYHGQLGQMLLRGLPTLLRVRLIAPVGMRVRAVIEERGVDTATAEHYIREVDEDRARWGRALYGVDLRDAALYDLVINLEQITIPSACAVVVAAASRPEFIGTGEVRARLEDFRLASRVKLALATAPASKGLKLDVSASGGSVVVRGGVPEAAWTTHTSTRYEQELRRVAGAVEGVRELTLELEAVDLYH